MHPWIERGYSICPVWAQNIGISAFGLSYRGQRLGGHFGQYVAEFRERDRWPKDQMAIYLESRLRQTLLRAYQLVPHYRRKWSAAGIAPTDLERFTLDRLPQLPISAKEELRGQLSDFLISPLPKTTKIYYNPSSGSTGTPINAVWSADVRRRLIAAREARSFGWAGVSVRSPRATIGGRIVAPGQNHKGPYYRYNFVERHTYFSAYHLSPRNAASYVFGFNRFKPRVLTGYAHCYYFLAGFMLAQGLKLNYRPDALVLSSEPLTAEMKKTISDAFGARAYEEYGSVENCVLATECSEGRLHANLDFGILEIVDENNKPVPAGEPGAVLATGLLNDVQYLIRYRIGDIATWSTERCSCGRDHLPVLSSLDGRLEDVLVGPDGRKMVRFHALFLNLQNVIEAQVVQETVDHLRVKVVANQGFGELEANTIRQRAVDRLGPVHVTVERVESIPRNKRGKFRAVVSNLSDQHRKAAQG